MKTNLRTSLVFAALALTLIGAINGFAQKRPPTAGGYKEVLVSDAAVKEAAEFAVGEHSRKTDVSLELVAIEKAEKQVVQGANYRMCIEVKATEQEDGDATQFVLAVVYQNLKNELSLTSWKPGDCAKKE